MIGKNKLSHMNIPLIIQNKTFKYYYIGDYLIIFYTKNCLQKALLKAQT
jgi:hypothetical protein